MRIKIIGLALTLLLGLGSCKKESVTDYDCASITPTYTTNIEPILRVSCAVLGCHNFGSAQGGVSLADYQDVKSSANKDRLVGAVQQKSGFSAMPPSGQLPDSSIEMISCWVQNGMPQ
jgi:hypothetical protein